MINDYKKIKMDSVLNNLPPANDIPDKEEKALINIQNSIIDNHSRQIQIANSLVLLLLMAALCALTFIFF